MQVSNDSAEVGEAETVTIPEEERVTVRLKFLNDTLKDVEASLVENVGQFKRRNFSQEISSNKHSDFDETKKLATTFKRKPQVGNVALEKRTVVVDQTLISGFVVLYYIYGIM